MIPNEYEITWEVQMTFDINMTSLQSTSFVLTHFEPLPSLGVTKKQIMKDISETWGGRSFMSDFEDLEQTTTGTGGVSS